MGLMGCRWNECWRATWVLTFVVIGFGARFAPIDRNLLSSNIYHLISLVLIKFICLTPR